MKNALKFESEFVMQIEVNSKKQTELVNIRKKKLRSMKTEIVRKIN